MGETSGATLSIKERRQKLRRATNSTLQTPLPQQSSSSAREGEDDWEVMEERCRRRIVFENLAKGMLRYLDSCNDVKVGITELRERVQVPLQFGISTQQVTQQAMNEDGQKIFEVFWQEDGRIMYCLLGQMGGAMRKGSVELERRCQDKSRGNTDAQTEEALQLAK